MTRIDRADIEQTGASQSFVPKSLTVMLKGRSLTFGFQNWLAGTFGVAILFSCFVVGISGSLVADDWSQINGPTRNGIVSDTELFRDWGSMKLQTAWSREIGQGNSGPVVVGDRLYIFHRPGKSYLLEALNKNTGALLWQRELPAGYTGGVDGDLGPKSVPIVSQGKIFLLGTEGNLFCVDTEDGELKWQRELLKDYRAQPGYFGVGSSPIV
ncbi:MAG: PQQ-binding-like beta-propeller repeat protein, partial [Mariniblastus sp.]